MLDSRPQKSVVDPGSLAPKRVPLRGDDDTLSALSSTRLGSPRTVPLPYKLGPADAAIFETFVVPRYLSHFGELAMEMLVSGPAARLLHIGCRTGYPDLKLCELIDQPEILSLDVSLPALELARHKAAVLGQTAIEYRFSEWLPPQADAGMFTHILSLHPLLPDPARLDLEAAMRWLLCSGGQALLAIPLRGSFQEVLDLLREYALKHDEAGFANLLESVLSERPTLETLSQELEDAGFEDIDVEVRNVVLPFDSGRAFLEDPITRLMILPELATWLGIQDLRGPLEYVREAMDLYWSEGTLELSINVGCVSARCP